MSGSVRRRGSAIVGAVIAGLAMLAFAAPASAQAGGPGAQATPVVGVSGTAACPTPVPAAQVAGTFASGPFTVTGDGACTSFSADSQGSYTVGGSGPLAFNSGCQTGGLQSGGGVTVPAGTVVNGVAVVAPTTVTAANTPVVFPNGTAATLNVVQTTATTVTRTAIVAGGTSIGRVICGAANVYPLAVSGAGEAVEAVTGLSSSGGSGGVNMVLVGAGALAIALLAQVLIGRRIRRSNA